MAMMRVAGMCVIPIVIVIAIVVAIVVVPIVTVTVTVIVGIQCVGSLHQSPTS
jgi:hypothetical protein